MDTDVECPVCDGCSVYCGYCGGGAECDAKAPDHDTHEHERACGFCSGTGFVGRRVADEWERVHRDYRAARLAELNQLALPGTEEDITW